MIKPWLIILMVMALSLLWMFASDTPTVRTSISTPPVLEIPDDLTDSEEALKRINRIRAKHNLGKLALHETTQEVARRRTKDMVKNDYWSHDGFDEMIWEYIPPDTFMWWGENLARCQEDWDTLYNDWMASPAHRETILDDWQYFGHYAQRDEDYSNCYKITQIFLIK